MGIFADVEFIQSVLTAPIDWRRLNKPNDAGGLTQPVFLYKHCFLLSGAF